jgi:TRAP-type C4-dicarboxylate transport system permease small subunit
MRVVKHRELAWWEEAVIALSAWMTVLVAMLATERARRNASRNAR